tara:strand:+ start:768 stop:1397 length:630 start_codon:yes stop_codon:yes gene_type:complete
MNIFIFILTVRIAVFLTHNLSDIISYKYEPLRIQEYKLTISDKICLSVNMILETIFTYWIFYYNLRIISFFFPINVFLLFLFDDLLYAPYHHFLHHKYIYKYVHFRHHLISHPSKSYIHASMENPLEMLGALLIHEFVIYVLSPILDKFSIFVHLFFKALGACLNHSGRNVECFIYSTKYHHLHHMKRKCNYSQYFFLYDRILNTLQNK